MRTDMRCVEVKVHDFASFELEKKGEDLFLCCYTVRAFGEKVSFTCFLLVLALISTVSVFNAEPLPFFISVL